MITIVHVLYQDFSFFFSGIHGTHTINHHCYRKGTKKIPGVYAYEYVYFNITECGRYNFTISGKASPDDKDFYPLAHRTYPDDARLKQVDYGYTMAKMGFYDSFLKECWPDTTYDITCGNVTHKGVKVTNVLPIYNLFPGERYVCTYEYAGHKLTRNATLAAQTVYELYSSDAAEFSVHDTAIFLPRDPISKVLANPNMTVSVKVDKLDGTYSYYTDERETFIVSGHDAVEYGVTGLRPATQYSVCVNISQVEGTCTFECKSKKWCKTLMTLPLMAPHQGSVTGLWVMCSFLAFVVVTLVAERVLKCMGVDVVGPLASKLGCARWKKGGDGNSNTQDCPIMQEMFEIDLASPN